MLLLEPIVALSVGALVLGGVLSKVETRGSLTGIGSGGKSNGRFNSNGVSRHFLQTRKRVFCN